ncbi:MAG TPA: anthranilate synthase component I family protein, partial [Chitinophagales bacterium]|nr:anthranilate synthase component I family protein [Chitinophagales bacterium]
KKAITTAKVGKVLPTLNQLQTQIQAKNNTKPIDKWLFLALAYDVKNETEPNSNLYTRQPNSMGFPDLIALQPDLLLKIRKNGWCEIEISDKYAKLWPPEKIRNAIESKNTFDFTNKLAGNLLNGKPLVNLTQPIAPFISKKRYLQQIKAMQKHICQGNIYEANFCQSFVAKNAQISHPWALFNKFNSLNAAPFAGFMHVGHWQLYCGSPERFIQKTGNQIISQPIKGTPNRAAPPQLDAALAQALRQNPKEQAENVMIVDLVRNDLARMAQLGSVRVAELFGVYSFAKVHHLISTITAQLPQININFTQILQACFPMGSMTGAPKISAMQICNTLEASRRGMYAGTMGYIDPNGNFDFNVIIRSLIFNAKKQILSFQVGGAITHQSNPLAEYEECLLKATTMLDVLQ